jgi:hypothetical protein
MATAAMTRRGRTGGDLEAVPERFGGRLQHARRKLVGGGDRLGSGVGRNGVRDLVAIHGRADAPEYATCARERPAAGSRSVVRGRRGTVFLKPSNDAHRPRADAMARQQLPIAGVPSGSERRHPRADEAANRRAGKPQGRLVERRCGVGLSRLVHGSLALGQVDAPPTAAHEYECK